MRSRPTLVRFFDRLLSPRVKEWVIRKLEYYPELCVEAMSRNNCKDFTFESVANWPNQINGFEDLQFLFACSQLNMGIAALALDEAAYLYKLANHVKNGRIVEIGRFKGGGTFLLANAMGEGTKLDSIDLHVKLTGEFSGPSLDAKLCSALKRYSLDHRVNILVGNSSEIERGIIPVNMIFIDGDHSYEGVKKDFLHWQQMVSQGGDVVFHDAANQRPFSTYHEEVDQFLREMEKDFGGQFNRIRNVGSIVHYRKESVAK
jgi:predicted O-methyltransferase YrrM